ncbi:MAG: hypothetical protein ACXV98_09960 [Ilumatobacteraceae bacterium]
MSGHDHQHPHDHPHHHHHRVPQGGPVVFDIGDDIGALIVLLDEALEGTEVPIEWDRDPSKDVHTGVWRRSLGNDSVVVAVYPELIEGRYRVPALGGHAPRDVDIVGGQVTEIDLREHRHSYT